jgi:hypothetical protein
MTVNDLIGNITIRARELADMKLDALRASYPEATDTPAELIRHCKELGLTRGQLIEAILVEEFLLEFDVEIGGIE